MTLFRRWCYKFPRKQIKSDENVRFSDETYEPIIVSQEYYVEMYDLNPNLLFISQLIIIVFWKKLLSKPCYIIKSRLVGARQTYLCSRSECLIAGNKIKIIQFVSDLRQQVNTLL